MPSRPRGNRPTVRLSAVPVARPWECPLKMLPLTALHRLYTAAGGGSDTTGWGSREGQTTELPAAPVTCEAVGLSGRDTAPLRAQLRNDRPARRRGSRGFRVLLVIVRHTVARRLWPGASSPGATSSGPGGGRRTRLRSVRVAAHRDGAGDGRSRGGVHAPARADGVVVAGTRAARRRPSGPGCRSAHGSPHPRVRRSEPMSGVGAGGSVERRVSQAPSGRQSDRRRCRGANP
jgi:hypothetical protein